MELELDIGNIFTLVTFSFSCCFIVFPFVCSSFVISDGEAPSLRNSSFVIRQVLCGTRSLEDDLINDARMKGWLVQIDQRCQRVMNLPNRIPHEDIELAAMAYGIGGSTACVENILANIRMNRLTSCLALTASWCAGNNKSRQKHPLTWESFRAVYRSQFEEV